MPLYKPDIAQMSDHLVTKLIRNLNDIARIINNLDNSNISSNANISSSKIDLSGLSLNSESAFRVNVWRIDSNKYISETDERTICSGVLLLINGSITISDNAELLIL